MDPFYPPFNRLVIISSFTESLRFRIKKKKKKKEIITTNSVQLFFMKFFSKKIKSKTEERKKLYNNFLCDNNFPWFINPDIIFNERDESDILLATAKIAQE